MISRLQGTLVTKMPPTILVDVGGVGYEVDIPMTTLYDLPEVGSAVMLYTHLAIREDAHQLFGFLTEADRRLFRELIKVNGIGGRTALAILSGMNSLDFIDCILQENIALLIKIPGIGRKTAERIIIEMRDRVKPWKNGDAVPSIPGKLSTTSLNNSKDEAAAALIALGYRPQDAQKAIEKCYNESMSSEDIIRQALKNML